MWLKLACCCVAATSILTGIVCRLMQSEQKTMWKKTDTKIAEIPLLLANKWFKPLSRTCLAAF